MKENGKIAITLIASFFIVSAIIFLIYPFIEELTYSEMIKENFLFIVYMGVGYALILGLFTPFSLYDIVLPFVFLFGIIFPIVLIFKLKRIFPYLIISILLYCIYLFFGIIAFGIRKGGG